MEQKQIEELVNSLGWYHTIDLGNGVITQGIYDHRCYLDQYGLPDSLTGKTALDIGPASGFFTFELERRGADVSVVELPNWESHDFGPLYVSDMDPKAAQNYLHEPFRVAAELLHSRVQRNQMTIYEVSPQSVGEFDLVFCGSLLIHLSDPIRALWRIQQVTTGVAIISTVISCEHNHGPVASFIGHHRGDAWWEPNRSALEMMVKSAGFRGWQWWSDFRLDYRDGAPGPYHGVIHAWNTPERPDWLPDPSTQPKPVRQHQSSENNSQTSDANLIDPLEALRRERNEWRQLAEGYANGRVMRMLNWINRTVSGANHK